MSQEFSQILSRKTTFDSGHRVMNERMKCFNLHGHTYLCEVQFSFNSMASIGYAIDFKEVKRVGLQWIDDTLDHGMLLNPKDEEVIELTRKMGSKLWLMSLNGRDKYCNPTAELIAQELFLAMEILFEQYDSLKVHAIHLNETPKCKVICTKQSISDEARANFYKVRGEEIREYAIEKGIIEYDDRNI